MVAIIAYFMADLKIVDLDMRPFTGGNDFSAYCWKTDAGLYIILTCSCIFLNNILLLVNAHIHKILAGLPLENLDSCATGCVAVCIDGHYLVVPVKLNKTIPIDQNGEISGSNSVGNECSGVRMVYDYNTDVEVITSGIKALSLEDALVCDASLLFRNPCFAGVDFAAVDVAGNGFSGSDSAAIITGFASIAVMFANVSSHGKVGLASSGFDVLDSGILHFNNIALDTVVLLPVVVFLTL